MKLPGFLQPPDYFGLSPTRTSISLQQLTFQINGLLQIASSRYIIPRQSATSTLAVYIEELSSFSSIWSITLPLLIPWNTLANILHHRVFATATTEDIDFEQPPALSESDKCQ